MGKIRVVVGGQYGSESKGRTAGFLLSEDTSPEPQMTIRIGGPQAGHIVTGRDPDTGEDGFHWKLRSIPVGAVCRPDAALVIGAGSEVDPERLNFELGELDRAGYDATGRLTIDPTATWMSPKHKADEQASTLVERLGSTATGVGAARCDRIMRTAELAGDSVHPNVAHAPTRDRVREHLNVHGGDVLIEAAQGCHLDLYRGPYPFATSGRTTAIDALASAEIVPWLYPQHELQVWLSVRTFPIRVGGNSGPLRFETSWTALGLAPEVTTVTKRIRRVGRWDADQVAQSVEWCGGVPTVRLSVSHLDYLFPEVAEAKSCDDFRDDVHVWLGRVERETGAQIGLVGVSPSTTLVYRGDLL